MISQFLLDKYRKKEISFIQFAKEMDISHQKLSYLFKKEGILTNKSLNKQKLNHTIFDKIDSFEKAYLLGYFIADGCIYLSKSGNMFNKRLSFSATEKDIELLNFVKNQLNTDNKIHISKIKYKVKGTVYCSQPMASISVTSERIFDRLNEMGIGERKTNLTYSLPNFENDDLTFKFLLGLFDGDGGINISNGIRGNYKYTNYAWYLTSNCFEFLEDIKEFLNKFDIKSSISKDRKSFRLGVYSKKSLILLRDLLYKDTPLGLTRKLNKLKGIPS